MYSYEGSCFSWCTLHVMFGSEKMTCLWRCPLFSVCSCVHTCHCFTFSLYTRMEKELILTDVLHFCKLIVIFAIRCSNTYMHIYVYMCTYYVHELISRHIHVTSYYICIKLFVICAYTGLLHFLTRTVEYM